MDDNNLMELYKLIERINARVNNQIYKIKTMRAKVSSAAMISVKSKHYSVPSQYIGKDVSYQELFQRDRSVIGKHVRNIFKEGELQKAAVWAKFAHTAADGKVYDVDYYNLDVIISVGYRVKSQRGVQFRIWAAGILPLRAVSQR